MSRPLKRGTIIKTIWLTGDTHEIDCRRDGIKRLGFRAEFGRERSNMSYDLYRSNATALEHATIERDPPDRRAINEHLAGAWARWQGARRTRPSVCTSIKASRMPEGARP